MTKYKLDIVKKISYIQKNIEANKYSGSELVYWRYFKGALLNGMEQSVARWRMEYNLQRNELFKKLTRNAKNNKGLDADEIAKIAGFNDGLCWLLDKE